MTSGNASSFSSDHEIRHWTAINKFVESSKRIKLERNQIIFPKRTNITSHAGTTNGASKILLGSAKSGRKNKCPKRY